MMRQSEFKKKFDPELGRFTIQHIYGEGGVEGGGIKDVFKSIGSKLFGQTVKSAVKKGAKKAVTAAATKTGEHAGKKAGDKIVQLLSNGGVASPAGSPRNPPIRGTYGQALRAPLNTPPLTKKMTQKEINQRVNSILSGGKIRR